MEIKFQTQETNKVEALVILTKEACLESLSPLYYNDQIKDFIKAQELKFDGETLLSFHNPVDPKNKVYFIGFPEEVSLSTMLDAFGAIGKQVSSQKAKSIFIHGEGIKDLLKEEDYLISAIKGLYAGSYEFNDFKSTKKTAIPEEFGLFLTKEEIPGLEEKLAKAKHVGESIKLARLLVNEPANNLKPTTLANKAVETFKDTAVEVQVFSRDEIAELGMNLFLTVAKGSDEEPKLIVMRYNGNKNSSERIGLIGKGLTFDSGGYSLKPTPAMITMKCDMAGSATVIGAMRIIAEEKPEVNVTAVVAACENMISGRAYLPGDIIKSMNGKTVEIGNTDAEGRLTLADAITYAIRKENATKIVDICTLTGSCVAALGQEYAGVVTWSDKDWDTLKEVSDLTVDPCWRLPLNKSIKSMNEGKMGDLCNIGGPVCGMQTAGSFLGEFVEDLPWLHIDIAGTAFIEKEKPAFRTGATGFGVHLLSQLVKKF